jgi:lactose/L-arabinose transport system substrate-binding protein
MRKSRMKKAVIAAAAITMVITGCSSGSPGKATSGGTGATVCKNSPADPTGGAPKGSDEAADLTLWGWYDAPPKGVMDGFHKLYPNVNVKIVNFNSQDTATKLITALNAGTGAPDMSYVQDRDAPRFAGLPLVDITKCMKPYASDFPAYKWKKTLRPDGTSMSVPWEAGPITLVYRRSLFEKYGVDPNSLATWDDYIAAGKKIDSESGGKVKMIMSNTAANPSGTESSVAADFGILSQENSGQWFSADGKNVTIDNPKSAQALELLKRFRDEGITLNDVASAQAEYATMTHATVATYLAPNWWRFFPTGNAPKTSGDWGAVLLPAFSDGGARGSNRGGTSLVITKQSKHQALTWDFLQYWLLTTQGRLDAWKAGHLYESVFKPASEDPGFKAPDPFFGGDAWMTLGAESAAQAPPMPESRYMVNVETELGSSLPAFLAGDTSAQKTLAHIQETVSAQK